MALNIIFSGGESATNLSIAIVETLSHDDSNSHSFSSDGHEFRGGRGTWPLAPLYPPLNRMQKKEMYQTDRQTAAMAASASM